MIHKKIVIVGGGPVGLSMALLLAQNKKQVTLIDNAVDKKSDGRMLALSYASYQILESLGGWKEDAVTPIDCVNISHHGLGVSEIKSSKLNLKHLGYTIKYADLCGKLSDKVTANSLIEKVAAQVIEVNDGANYATIAYQLDNKEYLITADLIIMAEGGQLLGDELKKISYDYQQYAIVAHIKTKVKSSHTAYERLTTKGPLVLLPYEDHFVVVWSLPTQLARSLTENPTAFIARLDDEFTARLGGAELISDLSSYPLHLVQLKKRMLERVVMVGNSAQIVHPVSAQGLNLGLRDIVTLNRLIIGNTEIDPGYLQKFDELRKQDANHVIGFTHFLASSSERSGKFFDYIRAAGLITLSNSPLIQDWIARSLIFGV